MEKTICLLNDYLGIREQQNITRDLNLFVALILDSMYSGRSEFK